MPRDHARLQTSIWRDIDFRSLTRDAQHLYFVLLSQQTLSYCGVMDWWPNRLATLADDINEKDVYNAACELIERGYICADSETSELLIRTYIKHDGVMQRVNMGKAVARALLKVTSLTLIERIHTELARLYRESPDLAGWDGFAEICPDDFSTVLEIGSIR